ncbi:MAG: Bcr/CflA family drug resistance efflux transporter [Rhizobiales bacterium 65-79]|jgi:DHA1 family bicyclomycin/chloramphenicol resistance-like MFS transporter|nr:multidrug effflux MFS transporter [Hyphomicrobiales bacterium]OJU03132.1 MAG: Bcr/CflA family drug resistance efflux transporter [Rhizobiales bacterium 65-79]
MSTAPRPPSEETVSPPVMSERRVSIVGGLLVAIGPMSLSLFTPAMPEIVHAFGSTEAVVKLTLSLYFAGFAFAQLVCGPLSDGLGRRPVTIAFMAIYLAGSFLAVFAPSIDILIFARFLQGVGAAAGLAVSRAIVRDLFTSESSARILNLVGIILSVGPAISPTLGGFTLEFFGWHAIFLLMAAASVAVMLMTIFAIRETVRRDLSRIRPRALMRTYGALLINPRFFLPSLVVAGTSGAIYALATMLPFVLMTRVGMSPTAFGVGMLMQTGSYFVGSLVFRALMPRFGAFRLVGLGAVFVVAGAIALVLLLTLQGPSYWNVMGPVGCYAVGIAFCQPAMMTAAMAPFPKAAGAASAAMGFMQMGAGMVGGMAASLFADPVVAITIVIPIMGAIAVGSWLAWRRIPEEGLTAGDGITISSTPDD